MKPTVNQVSSLRDFCIFTPSFNHSASKKERFGNFPQCGRIAADRRETFHNVDGLPLAVGRLLTNVDGSPPTVGKLSTNCRIICLCPVIASEARQSRKMRQFTGLLRCARNDDYAKTLCPLKLYRGDARRASLQLRGGDCVEETWHAASLRAMHKPAITCYATNHSLQKS